MRNGTMGIVGLVLLSVSIAIGDPRTWTDTTGKFKLDAEFVALEDGIVTLRRASGKTLKLPLEKLSEPGRKVAKELAGIGKSDPDKASQEESLAAIKKLGLAYTKITDAGLAHLEGLTGLKSIFLNRTKVTDAGLVHLEGMTGLHVLNISDTDVTDAGLAHLKGLTGLKGVLLNGTKVTDAGLVHLEGMTGLHVLNLSNTKITDAGVAKLKAVLPDCMIANDKDKDKDDDDDDIGNRELAERLELEGPKILKKIRGAWGMSKEGYIEMLTQHYQGLAAMMKKQIAARADAEFDKGVFEFRDGKAKIYRPRDSAVDHTIKFLSADGTTGEFEITLAIGSGLPSEWEGKVSGDELILNGRKLIRLNDEESARRKEAIKNFDPFTVPGHRREVQAREMQMIMGLSRTLKAYSIDHDGAYPASLDDPNFLEESEMRGVLELKDGKTGEVAQPWYLKGQSAASLAGEILIASPWVYDETRAVVFCDFSGQVIKEGRFQEELAKILESGDRELVK